ncbi:hypothetical protein DFH06DRAFT_1445697 [Mycena polygramma]|nr:hypothetical protein DFH06DRAFT_1445697 [Mycena polygramma]
MSISGTMAVGAPRPLDAMHGDALRVDFGHQPSSLGARRYERLRDHNKPGVARAEISASRSVAAAPGAGYSRIPRLSWPLVATVPTTLALSEALRTSTTMAADARVVRNRHCGQGMYHPAKDDAAGSHPRAPVPRSTRCTLEYQGSACVLVASRAGFSNIPASGWDFENDGPQSAGFFAIPLLNRETPCAVCTQQCDEVTDVRETCLSVVYARYRPSFSRASGRLYLLDVREGCAGTSLLFSSERRARMCFGKTDEFQTLEEIEWTRTDHQFPPQIRVDPKLVRPVPNESTRPVAKLTAPQPGQSYGSLCTMARDVEVHHLAATQFELGVRARSASRGPPSTRLHNFADLCEPSIPEPGGKWVQELHLASARCRGGVDNTEAAIEKAAVSVALETKTLVVE